MLVINVLKNEVSSDYTEILLLAVMRKTDTKDRQTIKWKN